MNDASAIAQLAERVNPLLLHAMRTTRMIGAVTPLNAANERARLVATLARGEDPRPAWEYAPQANDEVRRALLELADVIARQDRSAIASAYAARARELAREAEIAALAGTDAIAELARARFAGDTTDIAQADALAKTWVTLPREEPRDGLTRSDSDDAESLLSKMRAEIGRRKLPYIVRADPKLSALAATGETTIVIAVDRMLTREAVARTVLHEVEAHAAPRVRANAAKIGLFAIGTARGTDDQEGFALVLEERHGHFLPARRRELGARQLAVRAMEQGASFVDVVRMLMRDHDLAGGGAIAIAERVFRGSDGDFAGLGRERVYLPAFVRVKRALAKNANDEAILRAGQVAVDHVETLRPYV